MAALKHIKLSEEEEAAAILSAKLKKDAAIKHEEQLRRIEENRRQLVSDKWDYETTRNFALYRANQLFEGKFKVDKNNSFVFELLCRYFSEDKDFVIMAASIGVENPSLEKGILLAGTYGTGKTWLMKVFQKNKKACFLLHNAKDIASEFQVNGQEAAETYTTKRKNAFNDVALFMQPFAGLCVDDMGTEQIKNNYGNKSNVIGDLMEMRYAKGDTGKYLHATTNLSAGGLNDFYGGRVVSRMSAIFNVIELNGSDRRE